MSARPRSEDGQENSRRLLEEIESVVDLLLTLLVGHTGLQRSFDLLLHVRGFLF
jgi:hypothetical protein